MTVVLTALGHRWDGPIATVLGASRQVTIARRCADLPDLVATAAAGLGTVALVADDLRGLDLSTIASLHASGMRVVGVARDGDEGSERRLRQLGVDAVVVGSAALAELEAALLDDVDPAGVRLDTALGDGSVLAERVGDAAERVLGSTHTPDGGLGDDVVPLDSPGRVVAVWGPTGAPGRTTVAVTLASELAVLGVPTVLVDADTYGASVGQALSFLDEAPGVAAATRAADQGTLDLPLLARLAPVASPRLRVLTGLPRADRWPEVRGPALERVLTVCRSLGRVTVVDCGFSLEDDEELSYDTAAPRRNAATLTALTVADDVVVVGACDPVGLQRLVRAVQELAGVVPTRPIVVVNKVRAAAVGSQPERRVADALGRFAGVDDVLFVPDDRSALDTALLDGRSLAESAPGSPVRTAVRVLADRVSGTTASRVDRSRSTRRLKVPRS